MIIKILIFVLFIGGLVTLLFRFRSRLDHKEPFLHSVEIVISFFTLIFAFIIGNTQVEINQREIDLNFFPAVSITFESTQVNTLTSPNPQKCSDPMSINIKNLGGVGVIVSEFYSKEYTDLKLDEKIFISPTDDYSYSIPSVVTNETAANKPKNFCEYLLTKFKINKGQITRESVFLTLITPEDRLYEAELVFVIEKPLNEGTRIRMYVANIKKLNKSNRVL